MDQIRKKYIIIIIIIIPFQLLRHSGSICVHLSLSSTSSSVSPAACMSSLTVSINLLFRLSLLLLPGSSVSAILHPKSPERHLPKPQHCRLSCFVPKLPNMHCPSNVLISNLLSLPLLETTLLHCPPSHLCTCILSVLCWLSFLFSAVHTTTFLDNSYFISEGI